MPYAYVTRYFSLLSLVILALGAALIGAFNRSHHLANMTAHAERLNVSLTQQLGGLLRQDIDQLLQSEPGEAPLALQQRDGVLRLRDKLAPLIAGTQIAKVKVYDLQGITVFSTETAQIGESKRTNAGFLAARDGRVVSELVHRGEFSAFEGVMNEVDLLSSYVPVMDAGKVIAVFEQYQNLTADRAHMKRQAFEQLVVTCAVFGVLYVLLVGVVRRASAKVGEYAAALEGLNKELDQRVAARTLELQQSEQKLRISEARFRTLTAISSDFFWATDAEHRFTLRTASPQEAADPVFDAASFIGRLRWEVPYTAPDADAWALHRAVLDANKPFRNFEISRLGANGAVFHVSVSGDPVFDATGAFLGYQGVGTDVTERKQAQIELALAAAAFETQQSMLITDAAGRIQRVNQALLESTGFSAEELLGHTLSVLKSGRHDNGFYAAMWAQIHETDGWSGVLWGRRKGGELYPKWATISAIKGAGGTVTHYVAAYIDLSERKLAEAKIQNLSFFDQLTGLPNRTLFLDRLRQAVASNARSGTCGAVVLLGMDNFKNLNDTQGHTSGDLLLQQVAERLVATVRKSDTVARLGNDEFVIMLNSLDTDSVTEAAAAIESICQHLMSVLDAPYALRETGFHCAASMGVTLFQGHDTAEADVLRQADLAMQRSKAMGGGRYSFFDPSMESAALELVRMGTDLREALKAQQFELYYQPQVSFATGEIVGAEALVRWNHPERGMVSPAEFIPYVERLGLMVPLGSWVLEAACAHLASWAQHPGMQNLTVAVNVSAQQFMSPDIVDRVVAALEKTGANPQRLKLELTESVLADNDKDVGQVMLRLKTLGISFSLDDFGTGFSSLAYLSRLPLDQLKIDKSFVADIETGNSNVAICAAIISLARSLRLDVIAEGVETDAQRYFLGTVHKCNLYQGYLFSRPVPRADFEQMFANPLP